MQPWRKHTPAFVLCWHLYFAPVLRGGGTSACSLESALPVETCHPQAIKIILYMRKNGKLWSMTTENLDSAPSFEFLLHHALCFFLGECFALVVQFFPAC